jgi:hypothetical protein
MNLDLSIWREVSTAGAVSNIAGNGGLLASDTTPVLGAEATSEAMSITWADANADIIQASFALPLDFDDAADATLDLWVLTDNTGGGGIEAATFSVLTSWNNGAQVTDTATYSVPAITAHKVTATIAAAGASVLEIVHDRTFSGADVFSVTVDVTVQTADQAQVDSLRQHLLDDGFVVSSASGCSAIPAAYHEWLVSLVVLGKLGEG